MRRLSATLAAVGLLACACATPEPTGPLLTLEPVGDFKLEYSGEIGAAGLDKELPPYTAFEGEADYAYEIEVRFLRARPEVAKRLFGQRCLEIGASTVPASALTPEIVSQATLVSAPRLTVFEGQQGAIVISNEIAYISGFGISGEGATRVADPMISTVLDGLLVGLRAVSADGKGLRLGIDMTMAEVVRPIETQEVKLFGTTTQVQTPLVYSQRLKADGVVGEGKALVLTGMLGRDNDIYVVVITGRRVELEEQPKQD